MYDLSVSLITPDRGEGILIAGSRGKDSVAGMIIHVLKSLGIKFKYNPASTDLISSKADIVVLNSVPGENDNEFSTPEGYVKQFGIIIENMSKGASLIYYSDDEVVREIVLGSGSDIIKIPYNVHGYFQNKKGIFAVTINRTIPVLFSGDEEMLSLSAAREACLAAGVSEDDFYGAITSFRGAIS